MNAESMDLLHYLPPPTQPARPAAGDRYLTSTPVAAIVHTTCRLCHTEWRVPPGPFWMDGGDQRIETLCNARTGARHDHVVDQDDPTLFHSLEAGKAGIAGDLIGAGKGRPYALPR